MKNDAVEEITKFLFIDKKFSELSNYDLVVVLGNSFYAEMVAVLQRLEVENKINEHTKVVISGKKGGYNKDITSTEADIMYNRILRLNLKFDCILERNATNVKENLMFSKNLIGDLNKYNRILIVTKSFASRRVLMCADALGYPLDKMDIYGLEIKVRARDWYMDEESRQKVLYELGRVSKYTLAGDLKL